MHFKPNSLAFTLLLATLAALPPLSTDLYLSTLSVLGNALGCPPSAVGYTISIFLGSFALSQLVFGPLSDRFGRRPVGLFGCLLFTAASLGTTFAPSIGVLLLWRLFQGAGAGAAGMLAMAIIRDSFKGNAARTRFAYVNATQGFAPMIAPLLGSWIFALAGWRANLGILALGGTALTLAFGLGFKESLPKKRRQRLSPATLTRNYLRVLSNRTTLGYCLMNAFTVGSLLAYITASSFIFVDLLGVTRTHFGAILFVTAMGIMAGSTLAGKLSHWRMPQKKILRASLTANLVAMGSLLALSLAGHFTVALAVPLLLLMTLSNGLIAPGAVNGALAPMGELAGTASAVFGCLAMLGGSAASGLVSFLKAGTPVGLTTVMALFSLLSISAYTALVVPGEEETESAEKEEAAESI